MLFLQVVLFRKPWCYFCNKALSLTGYGERGPQLLRRLIRFGCGQDSANHRYAIRTCLHD